jgi:hypothetical protein
MKTFASLAAAAAFAASTALAFADSTALDAQQHWDENASNYGPGVYELMMDPATGTARSDDDFAAMWRDAMPEAQTNFRAACSEWEKDQVLYTDSVAARCKMAASNNGG